MTLSGLHVLLTYQCTFACDHCFVWGSPQQRGTLRLRQIREILEQAADLGTVGRIYFEGGEPFLYYAVLVRAAAEAADGGFEVGVVTNGYWATDLEDALAWLRPLAGLIQGLSVSSDLYHWDETLSQQVQNVQAAARELSMPLGTISVAQPGEESASLASLMFRGRAAEKLAHLVPHHPWRTFTACPYEDLRDPGRVHVGPLGYVQLCQGIALGNLYHIPLADLCAAYEPDSHPIVGPLLDGGPAELARRHGLTPKAAYADACHLCYETRRTLRQRYPELLAPDQVYGPAET